MIIIVIIRRHGHRPTTEYNISWDEMPKTLIWGFAPLKCHTVPSIIPKATQL
jgi:hypothetical protein